MRYYKTDGRLFNTNMQDLGIIERPAGIEGIEPDAGALPMTDTRFSDRDRQFDQSALESRIDQGGKGIFDIPVLGGIARAAAHPFLQAAAPINEATSIAGHLMTNPEEDYQLKYLSPSEDQAMNPNQPGSGPIPSALSGAKTGVGVGINSFGGQLTKGIEAAHLIPGQGIVNSGLNKSLAAFPTGAGFNIGQANSTPGSAVASGALASLLYPLMSALGSGSLTKKGATNKSSKAAELASKKGEGISWNDISTEIKDEVRKQYGDTPEVRRSLGKILNPEDLGQLDTRQAIKTPTELLDWRRQILSREGSNLFKNMFSGSDLDQKVAGTARSIISHNVHDLAPGTINPDQAYTLYSALRGDVPKLGLEAVGAGGAVAALTTALRSLTGR